MLVVSFSGGSVRASLLAHAERSVGEARRCNRGVKHAPGNMPGNMPDDAPPEPPSHEPPSQRQRVTRLLIVLLLLGVLVLVMVDQVLKPCKVSEAASQNAAPNGTDSPPEDCHAEKACS